MPRRRFYEERRDTGCIVTLQRRDDKETVSVTRPGKAKAALREIVAMFDPNDWRIVAISTPNTILADIRGRRTVYVEQGTERTARLLHGGDRIERPQNVSPEKAMLASIGAKAFL